MMFNRNNVLATIGLIILCSIFNIRITKAENNSNYLSSNSFEESMTIPEKADILLLYGEQLTDIEIKSIETIIKSFTYLQKSIVYLPYYEADSILYKYDYIICYNIDLNGRSIIKKLARLDKNVFFIGGNAVTDYIEETGLDLTAEKIDELPVFMEYNFYGQQAYSSLETIQDTYFLYGDFEYESGTINFENQIHAMFSGYDTFLYSPSIDITGEMLAAAFAKEAAYWLWPYNGEPHVYSQYIVLNEVYPFYPPERLLEIVDYLIEIRTPFVMSVMPIYENGDYPAMKRFCEVLSYAQANGGAVIMRNPNLVREVDDKEQIWEYLTYATEAYTNYGVYPLGIQVPESFLFDEVGREVLRRYSTVFCYNNGETETIKTLGYYNHIFNDGHNLIAPAFSINQEDNVQITTMATVAYIDITYDLNSIKEQIDGCMKSGMPLRNLWELEQSVYADNLYLYTNNGSLFFNGDRADIDYKPFEYEPYEYKSKVYQWILMDLTGFNKQLASIVFISSGIFITFIIIGRVRNKKRFLIHRKKESKDGLD